MKTPSFLRNLCSKNMRFHRHFMGINAPRGQNICTGFWVNINTKHQKMRWNGFEYDFQIHCTHFRHISSYLTYEGLGALLKQSNLRKIYFTNHHNVSIITWLGEKKCHHVSCSLYSKRKLCLIQCNVGFFMILRNYWNVLKFIETKHPTDFWLKKKFED